MEQTNHKLYDIEVDCANCANKMEEAIQKLPGVTLAVISFLSLKLTVEWEGIPEPELRKSIRAVCKKIDRDFKIY